MIDIYYAEDDNTISQTVKEYLEKRGYKVSVFSTIAHIKQALGKALPTLVLVDWNMPDGTGTMLCQWIRSNWKELPVIFLTVRKDSCDIVSGFQNGADDYVVKPFELDILLSRIQEKITNDKIIQGYMIILGGFCTLLAIIGIGNVFSNTLGFIRQRKREFARYMSVGLTPEGIRKMFCIEALVIAGRPILITIPLTVIAVGLMLKLSYLEPVIFIREMPLMPICIFILAIFIFVSLAYYLGGRKILRDNPAGALQEDTLL